jgi:hypothetical protein
MRFSESRPKGRLTLTELKMVAPTVMLFPAPKARAVAGNANDFVVLTLWAILGVLHLVSLFGTPTGDRPSV